MKIDEIQLGTPIIYRNEIIYFTDITASESFTYGYYLTHMAWAKDLYFNVLPKSSVKDKTYRTIAERKGLTKPTKKYITLDKKTLSKMQLLE